MLSEPNPPSLHYSTTPLLGHSITPLQSVGLLADQVFPSLPSPDERESVALRQYFRGERPGIVVRRHHHAVSARTHDCQEIVLLQLRHPAVDREKIAGFAHWPDDVD